MGIKISNLPEKLTLDNSELIPIVHSGDNFFITIATILDSITKSDVGLDQVDNTSDIDKPISTHMQLALDAKAAVGHTHSSNDIGDFSARVNSIIVAADLTANVVTVGLLEW